MTGKGVMSVVPAKRLQVMMALQILWLALVLFMGIWWTRFAMKQASVIQSLELQLGVSQSAVDERWRQVQRMLYWESGVYFLILLGIMILVMALYWRDTLRSRSLQAFFASLSHELKTPLTSIRLQAESLQEESHGPSPLLTRLLEDTQRLESQVERTLELARVEGGGAYYLRRVALLPLLKQVIGPWKESSKIEFNLDVPEESEVLADAGALCVVLRNIIENTKRHAGTQSRMRIQFLPQENGGAILEIHDNGGTPAESIQWKKLGNLYSKGQHSSGAGVGLYLVKTLMFKMEGSAHFLASTPQGFLVKLEFRSAKEAGRGA